MAITASVRVRGMGAIVPRRTCRDARTYSCVYWKCGIAFEDIVLMFAAPYLEALDERDDYGEERLITLGR